MRIASESDGRLKRVPSSPVQPEPLTDVDSRFKDHDAIPQRLLRKIKLSLNLYHSFMHDLPLHTASVNRLRAGYIRDRTVYCVVHVKL